MPIIRPPIKKTHVLTWDVSATGIGQRFSKVPTTDRFHRHFYWWSPVSSFITVDSGWQHLLWETWLSIKLVFGPESIDNNLDHNIPFRFTLLLKRPSQTFEKPGTVTRTTTKKMTNKWISTVDNRKYQLVVGS